MEKSTRNLTRGERNNNPGNIDRNTTKWQGMADNQSTDSRFVVFSAPVWGIRALAKVLLSYNKLYDIKTVRGFIDRWAPPRENDTDAYVEHVAKQLSCEPDDNINISQPTILKALTVAIIRHENGRCIYSNDLITQGVQKALQ
jgi:hypothetical protein